MNLQLITFILKESISNHIIKEWMKKENSEAKLIMVNNIRSRQSKLIKTCKDMF